MIKKVFYVLICLLILPIRIKAKSYEMLTYDIDIKINEDRTINVKEEYNIYFTEDCKFIRKLNNKINIIRPDGSKKTSKLNISNIGVKVNNIDTKYEIKNNEINVSKSNEKDNIENYIITYSYDYGKDSSVGYDEMFLDIINGKIDENISGINFKVELPKKVDKIDVKFLHNLKYTNNDIIYNIDNNIITGTMNGSLNSNESVSMYLKLPDKYFIGGTGNNYLYILTLIIPFVTIFYGMICFIKYGKNNKVTITKEENVPYDFNSAEIAYLYKGYLKEHDLISTFITLANEGYIEYIELDDGYKLSTFNSFKIKKLKDYDKDNAAIKILFEKMFQNKEVIELKDIEYNLYNSLVDAKSSIDNLDNQEKLFFKNVKSKKNILIILIVMSIIIMNSYSIYLFTNKIYLIPIINISMIFGIYMLYYANTKLLIRLIIGIVLIIPTLYIGIVPIMYDITMILIYIIGMIIIFISCYLYKIIPLRTRYGNETLSKIYSFKKSLEELSIAEIKEKLQQNENYYYDMYPYIYVLGLTDIWINKFNEIITAYPSWYITKEDFSLKKFQEFVNNMIFTVTQAMFKKQLTGQSSIHVEYHKDSIKE